MSREQPRVRLQKRNGTTYDGTTRRTPIGAMPDLIYVDGVPYVWSPQTPSTVHYAAVYTQAECGEWEPGEPDPSGSEGSDG